MDEINVHVVKRKGKKSLHLRYTDPVTGKRYERSSRTMNMKAALRAAGELQAELNASGLTRNLVVSWSDFRDDFFDNYVDHRSVGYSGNVAGTFNQVEATMKPDKLSRITTAWLKRFKTLMVKAEKPEATIHKYLQHLMTALKWAREQEYIKEVPTFPSQKRKAAKGKKHMKGRPVTTEEFERMLAACEYTSVQYLMRGLWLSGLRLGEALALTWDQWSDGIRIEVDGDDVYLLIDAEDQKNREAQLYPVVDEFSQFLLQTPPEARQGYIFNPQRARGIVSHRVDTVSDWLVVIGEKANVKVDMRKHRGTGEMVPSFASAHDLRRAFGQRWSQIVPPMILRDLMRHSSVETTEKYYVGINAKKTMEALRQYKRASEVTSEVTRDQNSDGQDAVNQQKRRAADRI